MYTISLIAYLTNVDVESGMIPPIHYAGRTHWIDQTKSAEYLLEVACYKENSRKGLQNCGTRKAQVQIPLRTADSIVAAITGNARKQLGSLD